MTRADLDKKPGEVSAMFDHVAERYDLLNDVLSLGQDRWWRRVVARAVGARAGQLVLDLAAGTGTSSRAFTGQGARCVACDFSLGMLTVGARRLRASPDARPGAGAVRFAAGDALALPFTSDVFDAVTISFGLRNIADTTAALRELRRVTKPGGRLVVCEFSHPTNGPFRTVYIEYLMRALPAIAQRVASNPDAYVYLADSIRAWPDQKGLATLVRASGWSRVAWRTLTGGIVALHRGYA